MKLRKGGISMKVKDIAMKETHVVSPTMSLTEIASMMKRHGVGAMPVCDGDKFGRKDFNQGIDDE